MSMSDWAKREVEIACKREAPDRKDGEWDYGCACYESALRAYLTLLEAGHSYMSFGFVRNIMERLLNEVPLTPIEGNDDDWEYVCDRENGTKVFQCKRMSSLFKEIDANGKITYGANNYYCVDENTGLTYTGGGAQALLDEYTEPITMPYFPPTKKHVIHTREYLSDRKNGDFDTVEYLYILTPEGERIDVHRSFGETEEGWRELSQVELAERIKKHFQREKAERETD